VPLSTTPYRDGSPFPNAENGECFIPGTADEWLKLARALFSPLLPPRALSPDLKISPAAVIDPDSTAIIAPAAALPAGRVTVLLYQLHSASRVGRAIVTVHIVGGARDHLARAITVVTAITVPMVAVTVPIPIPVAAAGFDHEVSPAAVVDPNAPPVRAPAVALGAGGVAALFHQPGPAVCWTVVPLAVVRRT
jgi:hypothetical protein